MSETSYFWQGGRKIEVQQDDAAVTIHAENEKFREGTPEHRMRDYFTAEHLVVEREIGNNTFLVRVTSETGRNPIRTANAAMLRPDVEFAEPNLVRRPN